MEFIFELIAAFVGEVVSGILLSPFYLLVFITGASLFWLFRRGKLPFSHFVDQNDEDKVLDNYKMGCAFYILVFFIWLYFF